MNTTAIGAYIIDDEIEAPLELSGEGPAPTSLVRYRRAVVPPVIHVRAERGASTWLGAVRFALPGGPMEIAVTLPRELVLRVARALDRAARKYHAHLHRSGRVGERINAHHTEALAARSCCGAVARRKMAAIASDPVLASKLGISQPATTTARALVAYRHARELLAAARTPAGRVAIEAIAHRAKRGDAAAARTARIVELVRRRAA